LARVWTAIKAAYDAGNKERYHRLIWRLRAYVQAGDVTSSEARIGCNTVFGTNLNQTQWTNNKVPKLTAIADRYQAFLDEGEF